MSTRRRIELLTVIPPSTRSHDPYTTRSRDHVTTGSQNTEQHRSELMQQWRPVVLDGTAPAGPDAGRPIGRDGTPAVWRLDETAEVCARHADALAAETEAAARAVLAQLAELDGIALHAAADPALDALVNDNRRRLFALHGALRRLAAGLGEMHTVLDELAHRARPLDGGA